MTFPFHPLFLTSLIAISPLFATEGPSAPNGWVCPPCGCASDIDATSKPGICGTCSMALIPKMYYDLEVERAHESGQRPKVAILLFNGVQIIDYTGPYEVFGQAGYEVFTVAPTKEMLVTNMGMKVTPDYGFEECPVADVLLVPGGGVRSILRNEASVAWVKTKAEATQHVLTVCNGSFILAKTGLLDGKSATTTAGLIDGLRHRQPEVNVISDKRYTESGKYVTTAGLSSGLDGSLFLISKMKGRALAQRVALNIEYDWKQSANYARANFADRHVVQSMVTRSHYPMLDLLNSKWELLDTKGNAQMWRFEWAVQGVSANALAKAFEEKVAKDTNWSRIKVKGETNPLHSRWQMPADEWLADWKIEKAESGLRVTLNIESNGKS